MCGIAGIFDTRGRSEPDRQRLRAMTDAILHRGPDAGGEHFEPGVALGHRRLSIIDVSGGQQPLANEDGSVLVVFNGEIYNYQPLVHELEAAGHRFRTRSDTEVIVHAWEQWGERCLDRLGGMFAFALWDRNRETLFLARDRLGKKSIYYTVLADGRLYFGSELKALLVEPAVRRELDPVAIEQYLAYGYIPEPLSIFKGVQKLRPAHALLWKRGAPQPAEREYWDVSFRPVPVGDERATGEELVARLREAVRMRLMSEVPLGAFLSGGVDSSAVVALMAETSSGPVNTCSMSFGDPRFNESSFAEQIARQFHTNHHSQQVDADDFDLLDRLAATYDEPFADSSAIPTYRVCELARKRVTVVLSGDGGDENFAGYRRYRWHMHEEAMRRRIPQSIRGPLFGALGHLYPKIDWAPRFLRAKTTFEALARSSLDGYFHGVSIMPDRLRLPLYSDAFRRSLQGYHAIEVLRVHAARAPCADALSLVQYLDIKTYLPGDILVKVDRASMAHSLEVRVPLLDHEFVDWVSGLDPGLKLRGNEGKYIFKKSLQSRLPEEILYRPKMGFAVPIASWFRGPLRARMRDLVLGPALRDTGFFEQKALARMVSEHESGARDHNAGLWALLMLASSLRRLGVS